MNNTNWDKISKNEEVISLLKQREEIEDKIRTLDVMALVKYELEKLTELENHE